MSFLGPWQPNQQAKLSEDQVKNNAGGYVYEVSDINRLRRFLCLGVESGTYYVGEKELGLQNAGVIQRMVLEGNGAQVVEELTLFSVEGRAAKQNPIIFALALCARQDHDLKVKKMAYDALPKVCRIPTHLFNFVEYCEKMSTTGTGWGRAHRRAIGNWYLRFCDNAAPLAMHVTKYKNRNNWSHRDLLRLAHPKTDNKNLNFIFKFVVNGLLEAEKAYINDETELEKDLKKIHRFLRAVEDVKTMQGSEEVAEVIRKRHLVREHIPTTQLNSFAVWDALAEKMPMTAMLRNLAKMTSVGLLKKHYPVCDVIVQRLNDDEALKSARIHPFNVLTARHTYSAGRGDKGKLKWEPVHDIVEALDSAFYKSFKFVEPTGLRYCIALDVSGSMSSTILGSSSISAAQGSAAMSMMTARTEANHEFIAFSHKIVPVKIRADMTLREVEKVIDDIPMGATDCAQPMLWAKKYNKLFDVFIVYTDCETWAGKVHPSAALRSYREASGIWNSKLIVCAMTASNFTLADPKDPGMLDMAGFDSAAPEVMRNFCLGLI